MSINDAKSEPGKAEILDRTRLSDDFVKLDRLTISVPTLAGGRQTIEREVHDHGSAVAVLPFDPERGKVLLVRQFRAPIFADRGDGMLLEVCAGLIDAGETDTREVAIREAEEELGVRPRNLVCLGSFYTCPGLVTENVTLFLAEYSQTDFVGPGGGLAAEHEDIEVLEWDIVELATALENGSIADMKTAVLARALVDGPGKQFLKL
ncbi:MAG: NUDIX hydrolase [Stappiaceae bacterium]